ncbi:MAG: IPExxxVDY family protein [Flavobacteriales bacterium]
MAKKKLMLVATPDVTVIGISSHVEDYRLCWAMNRSMDLTLTRRREDITMEEEGRTVHFSAFDQIDEQNIVRWSLVSNHCGKNLLLKEQKQADYFLVLDTEVADERPTLLDQLREVEFVLTTFPVDLRKMRAGHKLLHSNA